MNIDRVMLIVAIIVSAVLYCLMLVGGIAQSIPWWKLPLALAVGYLMSFALGAARRRGLLSETAKNFLDTVPFATSVAIIVTSQGPFRITELLLGFIFIEAILLALTFVAWLSARQKPEGH